MTADRTHAEVRRRFTAAPEKVFAAFAEAHLVGRWLSPSPEITLTLLEFEFHVGGAYRFAYHLPGEKPSSSAALIELSSRHLRLSSPGSSSRPTNTRASNPR
jgi:uncharacterized protein YndB with AHSA1/START domain